MDLNSLRRVLLDDPKRYWVDEPQNIGYDAYQRAGQKYNQSGEWSKADAAKHMAWQAELAKRTMLPPPVAAVLANVVGVGKETLIDGLGGATSALTGGGDPRGTWKNSLMDIWNNYVGASNQFSPQQAIDAAGNSTNSIWEALTKGLPYSDK